jgi:hypothetical protein
MRALPANMTDARVVFAADTRCLPRSRARYVTTSIRATYATINQGWKPKETMGADGLRHTQR